MSPQEKDAYNQAADAFNASLKKDDDYNNAADAFNAALYELGLTILPPQVNINISTWSETRPSILKENPLTRVGHKISRFGASILAVTRD